MHNEYVCRASGHRTLPAPRTGTVIIFHDNESTYFFGVLRWEFELFLSRLQGKDKYIYFAGKDSSGDFRDLTMRRKWVGSVRWEEN